MTEDTVRPKRASVRVRLQSVANLPFVACVLVMTNDILGAHFTQPVLVPYGQFLGATLDEIALFTTVRFAFNFISMAWMPKCADKYGRKKLLMISIVGSGLAYLVQGLSAFIGEAIGGEKSAVWVFIGGRALAGFFGGTKPVLQAAVTAMSVGDHDLLRTRLTILQAAELAFGFALSPAAGALAFFGLHMPWLVASIASALILIISAVVFQDTVQETTVEVKAAERKEEQANSAPLCDPRLLMMSVGSMFIFICVSGHMLALPMLLAQPSFNLVRADSEQTQKNVANALGVVGIGMGIANLFFSTAIFLALARKIGDRGCLTIGGVIVAAGFLAHGFMNRVWQIALLQSMVGAGVGLVGPSIGPVISLYAQQLHPAKSSQAMAVPLLGLTLGFTFGTNIVGAVLGDTSLERVRLAYIFCGSIFAVGVSNNMLAITLMKRRIAELKRKSEHDSPLALSPEQMEMAKATGAVELAPFIDEMSSTLQTMLTKGSDDCRNIPVWHGLVQDLVRRQLSNAFPKLPEFDSATQGADFFRELAKWSFPIMTTEERVNFMQRFPDVPIPSDYRHLFRQEAGREAMPTWVPVATMQGGMVGSVVEV